MFKDINPYSMQQPTLLKLVGESFESTQTSIISDLHPYPHVVPLLKKE